MAKLVKPSLPRATAGSEATCRKLLAADKEAKFEPWNPRNAIWVPISYSLTSVDFGPNSLKPRGQFRSRCLQLLTRSQAKWVD